MTNAERSEYYFNQAEEEAKSAKESAELTKNFVTELMKKLKK